MAEQLRFRWLPRVVMVVLIGIVLLVPPALPRSAVDASTTMMAKTGRRISGPASVDGPVSEYRIDPTGQFAVYRTFIPGPDPAIGTHHLFSVSLAPGALPVDLAGTLLPAPEFDLSFTIVPDGSRVIYTAFQSSANHQSVYSVPINGSATPKRLTKTGEHPKEVAVSPDSKWVIISTTSLNTNIEHLYQVSTNGTDATAHEITFPLAMDLDVEELRITPDSLYILLSGKFSGVSDWGIYSIPLAQNGESSGSLAMRLTREVTQQWQFNYLLTPNGQRLIYKYNFNDGVTSYSSLYIVPVAGPASAEKLLTGTAVNGRHIWSFDLALDGNALVFISDRLVDDKFELFSTPVNTRVSPRPFYYLNVAIPDNEDITDNWVFFSPNSLQVAYNAPQVHPRDIFLVPSYGPREANNQINGYVEPTKIFGWNTLLAFTPDSQRTVFTSMQTTGDSADLYSLPVGAEVSAAVKLNPNQVKNADGNAYIREFLISPTDDWVLFVGQSSQTGTTLYRVPVKGPSNQALALSPINSGVNVWEMNLVPGKSQVAYVQWTFSQGNELYLTDYGLRYVHLPLLRK